MQSCVWNGLVPTGSHRGNETLNSSHSNPFVTLWDPVLRWKAGGVDRYSGTAEFSASCAPYCSVCFWSPSASRGRAGRHVTGGAPPIPLGSGGRLVIPPRWAVLLLVSLLAVLPIAISVSHINHLKISSSYIL